MLAVSTGWTLEYIDSLPMSEFNNMMALNYLEPYTHDVGNRREGLLITETFNARRKKQLKVHEMFPYMSDSTPKWLSDETVQTARELIARHERGSELRGVKPDYAFIKPKIEEEIIIESEKNKPDELKIKQLTQLLGNMNNG